MFRLMIVALIALLPIAAPAAAEPRTFSCTGMMIEPQGLKQSPKTVRLTIGSPKGVSIDSDGHTVNLPVLSNNRIQLKFQAKEYVGEFFHYTNDLFLIHKSGHLAKLACDPA